jgi:thiol-disulfide isomerase/thioredoxin
MVASNELQLTDTRNNPYTIVREGERFILKGYENKIVLFDIFATWCQPCRAEVPHLASLQKKFPDDLVVIGVTIEDGMSNAKLETFKREYGANYIIFNSEANRALYRAIAGSIHVGQQFPIPLMVMYKNGSYVTHYMGMVAEEMIESDIKLALEAH